jgi:hypothetical protein
VSYSKYLIALLLAASSVANAANVAFYNDPGFVDSVQEGANLRNTLTANGHTVTDISTSTLAAFTAGLSGQDILVIPELQNGDLYAALDAPTRTLIANFVSGGKTIQVHGGTSPNDVNFMNGIFGYTLTTNGQAVSAATLTAAASTTQFATGPATVSPNSAVTQVATANIPAGGTCIYDLNAGADCVVFTVPEGTGEVIFLGWDWFGAPPQGAADGGWLEVADLISVAAAGPSTPATIPTMSEWGMMLLSSLMAMAAIVTLRRNRQ